MCHRHATSQDFLSLIYDVVSADYAISLSCRFSHGTAHIHVCPFHTCHNLNLEKIYNVHVHVHV